MDVPTLYNHAVAPRNGGHITALESDGGPCQALVMSMPGDVVQLPVRLQGAGGSEWMRRHLARCGIKVARHVTFCDSPVIARSQYPAPDFGFSVALFNAPMDEERPNINWLRAVKMWQSTKEVMRICDFYGISTAPLQDTQLCGQIDVHYRLDVRGPLYLDTTERLIDDGEGLTHVAPARYEGRGITDVLARRAWADGLRDFVTFTLGVKQLESDRKELVVLSCFPGCREPVYAAVAASRLSSCEGAPKSWEYRVLGTKYRCYDELALEEVEYKPSRGAGVVVIKWGTLLWGHLGVLLVGEQADRTALLRSLKDVFLS